MHKPIFHSQDFVDARVVWNILSVDPDVTPYEALDHDFCDYQSVLFVRFDNGVAMDVMWHPEVKPGGEFAISLNQSLEWDPFIEMRCHTFRELIALVRKTVETARARSLVLFEEESEEGV